MDRRLGFIVVLLAVILCEAAGAHASDVTLSSLGNAAVQALLATGVAFPCTLIVTALTRRSDRRRRRSRRVLWQRQFGLGAAVG